MTVFAPGSEINVFSPAASAPHSDDFKIATAQGISGFQPYMGFPSGRKSRFDPVKAKLDVGAITITCLDVRTTPGGTNAQRWVTAFVGDASGKARMIGLKAAIEESVDGGSTFLPYYVGRIQSFDLKGKLEFRLTILEDNTLQKIIKVFEGEATASLFDHDNGGYANRKQAMPYGPDIGYGNLNIMEKPRAKWRFANSDRNRALKIRRGSDFNFEPGRVWISKPIIDAVERGGDDAWKMQSEGRKGPVIARVTQGNTVGRFYVTYIRLFRVGGIFGRFSQPLLLHSCLLEEIESDRFEHLSLNAFADDSGVEFQILFENEPTEKFPVLLDDVHPVQIWKDILLCKHSRLDNTTGESLFSGSIEIDVAAFDTLIEDKTFRFSRWRIDEAEDMDKWIGKNILKPFGLGFRMEATASGGKFFSKVVPFNMALPTSLAGIQTIGGGDIAVGTNPTWVPGQPFINFETTWYAEKVTGLDNLSEGSENTTIAQGPENPTLISEFPITFTTLDLDNVHGKGGDYKADAKGIRYLHGELYRDDEYIRTITIFGFTINIGWPRQIVMQRLIRRLHEAAAFRWSRGPATVSITARRVAATNDCQIGDYRLLSVDVLPDPFSHTRGTARLMQCVERSEVANTPKITFRFIDSGQNIQRATPTVGEFEQISATNTGSGSISVLQAGRVETFFAVTSQDQPTVPDVTSSLWVQADVRDFSISSSQPITVGEFPDNSRIWVKANIKARSEDDFDLPSDFGFQEAPGFFDVSQILAAPTDLSVFALTVSGASAAWTIGDTTASVEVRLKQDDESDFTTFRTLQPGSTNIAIIGLSTLTSANPHKIGIRHRINETGTVSAEVTASFDITNILPQVQAPSINRIVVLDPQIGML